MSTQVPPVSDLESATAEIAEQVRASVVEVQSARWGAGAGIIWRSDGTIVTNNHVLRSDHARVRLADERQFDAEVAGRDPRNDLAVLSLRAANLPAATIGDARALRVGELVLAVGHPFGLRGAVTVGVVNGSVPDAVPAQARELVRADVLLGPGNSGGPLTNARGDVVGINSMVAGGLALAVPSHLAERLVARAGGQPFLGIGVVSVELPPALAARAPLNSGWGALVVNVALGSPAAQAGLLVGDVLVALDNRALFGADGLISALAAAPPGAVRLQVLRGGVPREVVILPAEARPLAA